MTALSSVSPLARDMLGFWAVLIGLGTVICTIQSYKNKKPLLMLLSSISFVPAYMYLWVRRKVLSGAVCFDLPWILYPLILASVSVALILILLRNRRFSASSITPASIKRFLDEIKCGICYFRQNGEVIFSNRYINRLCIGLTNKPLVDGNAFRSSITGDVITVDRRQYSFSVHRLTLDSEPVYEIIASDCSELYDKTEALRIDNEKLMQMNRELREYNLAIDDIVHRQEVLQAKIDIHDEMNQLIMSAAALGDSDLTTLARVFERWRHNLRLLRTDSDEKTQLTEYGRLEEFAKALGIQLNMNTSVPPGLTDRQRELLFMAAREAVTNAAKHANANLIDITFMENPSEIICSFKNNVTIPLGEVSFTGGLKNLKDIARDYSAEIKVEAGESFKLCLIFTKVA